LRYDTSSTGYLSREDLRQVIKESGLKISNRKLNTIIKNVDISNNDRIDYSEFLAATISCKNMLRKEQI
jgi:Ca2+-binding EF-hand superfamily protein